MARKRKTLLWCALALLYRATLWHAMAEVSSNVETTLEGLEVRILGIPVYGGRHLMETRYCG